MDTKLAIRQLICAHYEEGHCQMKIASLVKRSQPTVSGVLKQYNATGSASNRRKGNCKRPFLLNKRQMLLGDPTASAREIQAKLGGQFTKISLRSIQRYLRRVHCFAFHP